LKLSFDANPLPKILRHAARLFVSLAILQSEFSEYRRRSERLRDVQFFGGAMNNPMY
jgi:hypothetical protein